MSPVLPEARTAVIHTVQVGSGSPHVRSSISLVLDGSQRIIIDPGMAPSQSAIREPLRRAGVDPREVTDVVLSHHHPDHTMNVGLFPSARVHDHWAIYRNDIWDSRPAEGFVISPSVLLWETPGHTPQDISTLIGTPDGLVVATHLWFYAEGPPEDPFATDSSALHEHRSRVLAVADRIVPGHGPAFEPGANTPR